MRRFSLCRRVCDINFPYRILEQRKKESGEKEPDMSDVLDGAQKKARDHARTPMQVNSLAFALLF